MKISACSKKLIAFISMSIYGMSSGHTTPDAYYKPYDRLLKEETWHKSFFKLHAQLEDGQTKKSRNAHEDYVGLLQLYNPSESSLAMLMGAEPGTKLHAFANGLFSGLSDTTDDGKRGRLVVDGTFEKTTLSLSARHKLKSSFLGGYADLGLYLPLVATSITHVTWHDQTEQFLNADHIITSMVTNNLEGLTQQLGDLDISDWSMTGFGDASIIVKWYRDFPQEKPHLKNVRITGYGGVIIPTGAKKNEDKALSLPLGNDEAWGLPLSLALDLGFSHYIDAGIEVYFLWLLEKTRIRRLKTDENQTDFLLLNKGKATKSFGATWNFTLYLQLKDILQGLNIRTEYLFIKHDDDTLYPQDDRFIFHVVNTAQTLQHWHVHALTTHLTFDTAQHHPSWVIKPYAGLFYKFPFTGKRAIVPHSFGGQIGFTF